MPNNNRVMPNNTIAIILADMAPHRYFTKGTLNLRFPAEFKLQGR